MSKTVFNMIMIFFITIFSLGCSEDNSDNGVQSQSDSFTAVLSGSDFSGSFGAVALQYDFVGPLITSPFGRGNFHGESTVIGMTIANASVGTFALDGSNQWNAGVVTLEESNIEYSTSSGSGHGSVTISGISSSRISGTFSFVAYTDDGLDSIIVTNGSFDLPIAVQ